MADLTGQTLGKYRVTERLGRGGMAEVYKAYHPSLDRYVAIKVMHGHLADSEGFIERFNREAKSVANLRHPNIVQVFDYEHEGDMTYMVMEFVDGMTLKGKLIELWKQEKHLSFKGIFNIFSQVAEALDYAHKQGLYHRDIKPSNVLLENSGHAYLTDFGIARIVSDTQFTASGMLLGTPAYMAPEQGLGSPLTAACDIYALGIVLYELITGEVPFDADTPMAIINQHINAPLPMPRLIRQDMPEDLEKVILKALAKDPADRYQSALEMLEAFEQAIIDQYPETVSEVNGVKKIEPEIKPLEETLVDTATVMAAKEPPPLEPTAIAEEPVVEEEKPVPKKKEKPPAKPKEKRKVKALPIIIGVVVVAAVLVVVFATDLFKGADGESPIVSEADAPEIADVPEQPPTGGEAQVPVEQPGEQPPPPEGEFISTRARIRITTSSDWTDVYLDGGGVIHNPEVIFVDEWAGFDIAEDGKIFLNQECLTENTCRDTVLIFDFDLEGMDPEGVLIFRVVQGAWGFTGVEILSNPTEAIVSAPPHQTFMRDGDTPDHEAIFELPVRALLETRVVSVELGAHMRPNGIESSFNDGDGLYEPVRIEGSDAIRTIPMEPGAPVMFLYFRVNDDFLYNRNAAVLIQFEYFDVGFEMIGMDYDGAPRGGSNQNFYKYIDVVEMTNTETWMTAEVRLFDAFFANHQHDESDFRIGIHGETPLIIRYLSVTILP